jgi:putative SOS response-associated peptidase YedK
VLSFFSDSGELLYPVLHSKINAMTYVLESDHVTLERTFHAKRNFGFYQPRASVNPGDYVPVVRSTGGELLSSLEISLLRYGLVPPGFSSAREADRYGLHRVRATAYWKQREVSRLFAAGHRCLVPMTVDALEIAAAGLWGRWNRVRKGREERIESFAVFTVQDALDRWQPLVLEPWDWSAWLDGEITLEALSDMPPITAWATRSGHSAQQ